MSTFFAFPTILRNGFVLAACSLTVSFQSFPVDTQKCF